MDTSEKQIKRIVLDRMERCSVCHRPFDTDDVQVLSRKSDMWMLMVSCDECHARNFVAAVIGDGDAEEAQLALRRLGEEHLKAKLNIEPEMDVHDIPDEPVSVDDVLEMHGFLQEFDGDFKALFRAR
jgi:CRISPR/Cas system-associated protein Cas10 (large subunit of type III CRISPR-Cas system)